ncbi:MAG: XdhC family protein [Fimbriimonadaceae bacterium]|nr:XdhC family protein [Alphaproteobacteria bacterium]
MFDFGFIEETRRLRQQKTPFCTATIVDKRGSIPQIVGAKAIFSRNGLVQGSVGGGKLELRCQETATELLRGTSNSRTKFEKWNLRKDIGMTCAGELSVYFEIYCPDQDWRIVIFGAGHVSQKLCRMLIEMDCHVICIDTRSDWLDKLPPSDRLEKVQVETYSNGVAKVPDQSTVIVMTKGHAFDLPILLDIEKSGLKLSYLGVIGSDSKARILKRDLLEKGSSKNYVDRIICPVGEKIGNNTPAEISIGIIAQLLKLRTKSFVS